MKAARLYEYDEHMHVDLKLEMVPEPHITAADEVIVRVGAAGLCRTDLHIIEGVWRSAMDPNGTWLMLDSRGVEFENELVMSSANEPNCLQYGEKTHLCASNTLMERTGQTCRDHAPSHPMLLHGVPHIFLTAPLSYAAVGVHYGQAVIHQEAQDHAAACALIAWLLGQLIPAVMRLPVLHKHLHEPSQSLAPRAIAKSSLGQCRACAR